MLHRRVASCDQQGATRRYAEMHPEHSTEGKGTGMTDLADRISRGAVAALDLAPFDERFTRLSRQVLAGGASRFSRVVASDQPVHYVIPVGLAHDRISYGALVVQDRQAGIVWRGSDGVDHTTTVPLPGSPTTFQSVTLGGEAWMRFRVAGPDDELVFLTPPVNSPSLRSTLIDLFAARPGHDADATPLAAPEPEPAPRVRFPDPEPEPEPEASQEQTQVLAQPATDQPDDDTVWAPQAAQPEPRHTEADDQPTDEYDDLYRTVERRPGPSTPVSAPADVLEDTHVHQPASATVRTVEPVEAFTPATQPSAGSVTLKWFLIGLLGTLVVGAVVLLVLFLL